MTEAKSYEAYQTKFMTLKFQSKLLCMLMRIGDLLLLEGKVKLRFSTLSDLRININLSNVFHEQQPHIKCLTVISKRDLTL